jgi:hypothetical protein
VSARRTGIAWRLLVPLLLDGVLVIAHWLVADALDRAGLVERLLSPSGLDAIVALLAALVLFGLRFAVFFVAPALTLAWWVVVLGAQLARRAEVRLEDAPE